MTISGYLTALALTLAVEVPVMAGYASRALGTTPRRALGVAVAVNLMSHPVLTAWLLVAPSRWRPWAWTLGEVVVTLVEGLLLSKTWPSALGRALGVAMVANLASIGLGLLSVGPPW